MNSPEQIQKWCARYKSVKAKKDRWNDLWQYCGEYIHGRKQNFTEFNDEGTFLNREVFDSTGPKANRKMAASLIGILWQAGGKSIQLNPPRALEKNKEVQKFFEWMTEEVTEALDDPKAGLNLALEEYMIDQGCFGTSGVGCFEGKKEQSKLRFNAWGIDEIAIEEGENGFVRTIYREFEVSVLQAVEDYGYDSLSEATRKLFDDQKMTDKVRMLHIIAPRNEKDPGMKGNLAMDFMSLTLEIKNKHEVKESGYEEMPVPISRFYKRKSEMYGRSPAMDALPDILELNATKEARISAIEKSMDPPLGVYDDSIVGNEEVNTSARALNVFTASTRLGTRNPVFPLFTVETLSEVYRSVESLEQSINEHFNIDRLLDFNNETQMTLGEAQMRDRIRSQSLGSLFNRQINELFTPLIERAVAVLFRNGHLGVLDGSAEEAEQIKAGKKPMVIPATVARLLESGEEFYSLKYLTPAARMMETAEAEGVMRAWEFAGMVGQLRPDIYDNLDADESLKIISRNAGAPTTILIDDDTVKKMRDQRAEAMAAQQKLETMRQGAETVETIGKAGNQVKEAATPA